MSHLAISPPDQTEFASYYANYIKLVQGNDIIAALKDQMRSTRTFFRSYPESKGNFRYAPDKWSVKEVVTHLIDSERVFAYRALTFARNDSSSLPGFEQDDWMKAVSLDGARLEELANEFEFVRQSNISFFSHLDREAWMRRGIASDNPFTVRSLSYIIAGHELHHLQILKSRYA